MLPAALRRSGLMALHRQQLLGMENCWPAAAAASRAPLVTSAAAAAAARKAPAAAGGRGRRPALMIVESPAKAFKIQKFLGDDYRVIASYGHVRDLPPKAGSVRPSEDFAMDWALLPRARDRVAELARAASEAGEVVLATDPDREGEAISWHVLQELQRRGALDGKRVSRVTFNEVTSKAVRDALSAPREVSTPLVDAYLARRGLDYLVGFTLSPLLWRRLGRLARSAGRVQSVALRMVCDRESEIERFVPREYWTITAKLKTPDGAEVDARLTHVDQKKLPPMGVADKDTAEAIAARVRAVKAWTVKAAAARPGKRAPPPPFTTSTLQQEAAKRLGWGASKTMQVAQQLYEGENAGEGLITYMRTDGVTLSPDAVTAIRATVASRHGPDHLPPEPRAYKTRTKNAQEAHEAVRPTDPALSPSDLPPGVGGDMRRLYDLIWRRALACQMASAETLQVTVEATSGAGDLQLRASGVAVTFPGYLAIFQGLPAAAASEDAASDAEAAPKSDQDESEAAADEAALASGGGLSRALQQLKQGDVLRVGQVTPNQHITRPPARFNDGSMVKAMEEAGVGRPSTYAPTMKLLVDRGYCAKQGRTLVPTPLGRILSAFLERFFSEYVDAEFTARMEERLDDISDGRLAWRALLSDFWGGFNEKTQRMTANVTVTQVFDALDAALQDYAFPPRADGGDPRACPACGGRLVLKPNKLVGAFVACSNYSSSGCSYSRPLGDDPAGDYSDSEAGDASGDASGDGGSVWNVRQLGRHPQTGEELTVRKGPYGLYIAAVADGEEGKAARRNAALPATATMAEVTLSDAVAALAGPQSLGSHPEDGETVLIHPQGRFGPYLSHRNFLVSLPKDADPGTLTLEGAVALISAKAGRMAKRGRDAYAEAAARAKAKAGKAGKGKKKRAEKDGGGGRALNGYQLFAKSNRQRLVEETPGAVARDGFALVAAAWKALGPEGQSQWTADAKSAAAAAKAAAAGAGGGSGSGGGAKAAAGEGGRGEGGQSAVGRKSRGRPKKAKGGSKSSSSGGGGGEQKRPLSGYQLYLREHRPRLAAAAGGGAGAVMAAGAAEWRALSDAERTRYAELAANKAQSDAAPRAASDAGG